MIMYKQNIHLTKNRYFGRMEEWRVISMTEGTGRKYKKNLNTRFLGRHQ